MEGRLCLGERMIACFGSIGSMNAHVRKLAVKKLLLTSVVALFLATGAAQAVEWQCGPHYVSTMVLHGENWDRIRGCKYPIIAYPSYNRTREEAFKNNPSGGGDDEIGLPSHGFRWGHVPHPEFRGQCGLIYRGKPCFEYKGNEPVPVTYEFVIS